MFSIRSSLSLVVLGLSLLSNAAPSKRHHGGLQARSDIPLLQTRHTAGHQDPKKKITLYHGTPMSNLKDKMEHMVANWPPTGKGDFSRTGGIYLTDSLRAAAQWACYGKSTSDGQEGGIIEYTWDGESANVYPYSSWPSKADYQNFIHANFAGMLKDSGSLTRNEAKAKAAELVAFSKKHDMFEGPMETAEPKITDHFWQYAIVDLEAFKAHAKMTAGYKVACSKIAAGNSLKLDDTQGPVAKFSEAIT
ncbi:hypothetical protein BDZ89DRAFT_1115882, partial [Hymenopellis radicata]